jgi:hypothetical protein
MNTVNKRLLPLRTVSEHDVVNEYSLDRTGDAGMFVKVLAGNLNEPYGQVAADFGASFDRVTSPRWGSLKKITPTTSGDTKYEFFGITTYSTLEQDENAQQLKFYKQKGDELHSVISGQSVPVATKGRFQLGPDAYTVTGSAPNPTGTNSVQAAVNWVVVPSNFTAGKVDLVPKTRLVNQTSGVSTEYGKDQVIGKVIGSGNAFGGVVDVIIG